MWRWANVYTHIRIPFICDTAIIRYTMPCSFEDDLNMHCWWNEDNLVHFRTFKFATKGWTYCVNINYAYMYFTQSYLIISFHIIRKVMDETYFQISINGAIFFRYTGFLLWLPIPTVSLSLTDIRLMCGTALRTNAPIAIRQLRYCKIPIPRIRGSAWLSRRKYVSK